MVAWFKKSWVRRAGITLLFILVWIGVSIYTSYKFFLESYDIGWDGQDKGTGNVPRPIILHLDLVYRGFDPKAEKSSLDLTASLYETTQNLSDGESEAIRKLKEDVKPDLNIVLDGKKHAVILGEVEQITLPFTAEERDGIVNYPFDKYSQFIKVEAKVGKYPISFDFTIKQANKDFIISYAPMPTIKSKTQFKLLLHRPWYSVFISIFVLILMWFLALAMLNVAIDILFHHRDAEAGFIAGAFSLVFALPALRDAQPGIPEVGCFMDAIGFLW
ncbi:hypothetical protein DSO57_1004600 [Entomophthora muscae]|uniref:Uncharacterized protein n=1 Tax=Entomophthora muscae TaxID=34485 RepID=A0ACC2TVV3_9FUNG|nr:hypothetical protein DSO57_1004600 [Entomophthora muscae]